MVINDRIMKDLTPEDKDIVIEALERMELFYERKTHYKDKAKEVKAVLNKIKE